MLGWPTLLPSGIRQYRLMSGAITRLLKNNMSMSFRADLSANSILLVQLFPSKKDSDAHHEAVNAMVTQIKEGGAIVKQMEGEVSNFFVSGNLTLDDLKGSS